MFPKKIRRFAAGFCCFQKFPPPAAGICFYPNIHDFVADFHRFCLEKAQNFPAASRRGLVIQKISAASRRGFVVPKKISAASRRGLVISKFLRKVGSGDIKWGGFHCYLPGIVANQKKYFRSPNRHVQVSECEVLVSLQDPFCRFVLTHSNLSLFTWSAGRSC